MEAKLLRTPEGGPENVPSLKFRKKLLARFKSKKGERCSKTKGIGLVLSIASARICLNDSFILISTQEP